MLRYVRLIIGSCGDVVLRFLKNEKCHFEESPVGIDMAAKTSPWPGRPCRSFVSKCHPA
jgi:hypothetical protein